MTARTFTSGLLRAPLAVSAAGVAALLLHPGPGTSSSPRTVTVTLGDFFYRPAAVSIRVGERVRFVNRGRIEHTVADVGARGRILGRAIRPRLLATGETQTVVFRKAGIVRYVCTLHPTRMRGAVAVTPAS